MKQVLKLSSWRPVVQKSLYVLIIATLSACGGGGSGDAALTTSGSTAFVDATYFPVSIGDRWVYRTWSDDNVEASSQSLVKVIETLNVAGRDAKVVRTFGVLDGAEYDTQYLAVSENAMTALADPMTPPGTLQIPTVDLVRYSSGSASAFQQLDQTFDTGVDSDGDGRSESLRIKSQVDTIGLESVQVDAGSFGNCLHVKTTVVQTGIYTTGTKPYVVTTTVNSWYAPGIGLIKEDMETQFPHKPVSAYHQSLIKYNVASIKSESVAPTATLLKPNGVAPFISVEIAFSEYMDISSVTASTMQLRDAAGKTYPLSVTRGAASFSFYPAAGPLPSGTYTAVVGGLGADLVGNPITPASWTFDVDATAPVLVSITPSDGAKYVPINSAISLIFSEDIDPTSVPGNIYLTDSLGQVPSAIEAKGREVTIQPYAPLAIHQTYNVLVYGGLKDKSGNLYAKSESRSFRTDPGLFDEVSLPNGSVMVSSPDAVAIGDINGDGLKDVVMTNWFSGNPDVSYNDYKLLVYYQQANGQLGEPITLPTKQTYTCRAASVAIGDFNGDGRQDVVQAESGCGLEIFYQNAAGKLESSGFLPSDDSYQVRAVDINGDGRLDIVGIGWGTEKVSIWLQQPNGTLGGLQIYSLRHFGWESLAVGDINGDGRPDVVVSCSNVELTKSIAILYQLPDGTFGKPTYIGGGSVRSVAIGDVSGDGRNDLVIARSFYGGLGVALQDASGNLGTITNYLDSQSLEGVAIADINADGRSDVIVAMDSSMIIFQQKTDGSLARLDELSWGLGSNAGPQSLAIGDINNDGLPDLLSKGLFYRLNRSQPVVAAPSSTSRAQSVKRSSTSQVRLNQGRIQFLTALPGRSRSLTD